MFFLTQWARRRPGSRVAVAAAGALALGLAGYANTGAGAAVSAINGVQPSGAVSPKPAAGTPALIPNTGKKDLNRIAQMVQCGNTMFAVGTFSEIVQGGTNFPRSNIFSFEASAPYTITTWAPVVNGTINSITVNPANCADVYIGGDFTSVNGTAVKDIAEVDTTTGNVVSAFGHSTAGGEVQTLAYTSGHILVGGYFQWINGTDRNPFMASVSSVTGKDDGFLHLSISGHYHYCNNKGKCTTSTNSSVQKQQISHNGTYDLVEGNFTSVGGMQREQIFMLDLTTSRATVTAWTSPEWDGSSSSYPYQCIPVEAWYIRAAAWSPDDNTVYIATTGNQPNNGAGKGPRTGLCDAAAAFPATLGPVLHEWVEYTGCDSYYSVAADTTAVYVAGHPRWAENPDGCDAQGPGAVADPGLQGLNLSGGLLLRTSGKPLYTMARANADNMLITNSDGANGHGGLWIGSTNRFGAQSCGQISGHSGICFLPYSS